MYQGLDIIIFAVVKQHFCKERTAYKQCTGKKVVKDVFLLVHGATHIKAFTWENILSACQNTGVVPFNPGVITAEQMAPALALSSHSALPVALSTPEHVVSHLLLDLKTHAHQNPSDALTDATNSPSTSTPVARNLLDSGF